jgi:hypothetical protein
VISLVDGAMEVMSRLLLPPHVSHFLLMLQRLMMRNDEMRRDETRRDEGEMGEQLSVVGKFEKKNV